MSRLEKGGGSLIKTADDWRLDLSKALEGDTENNGLQNRITMGCATKTTSLLLCFTDREGKLDSMHGSDPIKHEGALQ